MRWKVMLSRCSNHGGRNEKLCLHPLPWPGAQISKLNPVSCQPISFFFASFSSEPNTRVPPSPSHPFNNQCWDWNSAPHFFHTWWLHYMQLLNTSFLFFSFFRYTKIFNVTNSLPLGICNAIHNEWQNPTEKINKKSSNQTLSCIRIY